MSHGYHIIPIPRGSLGELSKIQEELTEAMDAWEQGARIMVLLELSDLIGAVDLVLENHFPGFAIQDLITMARITRRAFESGDRE